MSAIKLLEICVLILAVSTLSSVNGWKFIKRSYVNVGDNMKSLYFMAVNRDASLVDHIETWQSQLSNLQDELRNTYPLMKPTTLSQFYQSVERLLLESCSRLDMFMRDPNYEQAEENLGSLLTQLKEKLNLFRSYFLDTSQSGNILRSAFLAGKCAPNKSEFRAKSLYDVYVVGMKMQTVYEGLISADAGEIPSYVKDFRPILIKLIRRYNKEVKWCKKNRKSLKNN